MRLLFNPADTVWLVYRSAGAILVPFLVLLALTLRPLLRRGVVDSTGFADVIGWFARGCAGHIGGLHIRRINLCNVSAWKDSFKVKRRLHELFQPSWPV